MKYLLKCSSEELEYLEQPFVYEEEFLGIRTTKELIPGGTNIIVDANNREEYVNSLLQAMLVKRVSGQLKEFNKGFFEILPAGIMRMLLPYELELLICGRSEIGLDDLKSLVRYVGYSQKDNVIQWFWEIIDEYSDEERTSLLFFITGKISWFIFLINGKGLLLCRQKDLGI